MQVLFCEQQLDCQLALEDPSPGMPWGRARFQARQGCRVCKGNTACVMLVVGGCWLVASQLVPKSCFDSWLVAPHVLTVFRAGHRILRPPVCGAAAPMRGWRRSRFPGLAVPLPQVGLTRRQVSSLLCAILRQAVSLAAKAASMAVLLQKVEAALQQRQLAGLCSNSWVSGNAAMSRTPHTCCEAAAKPLAGSATAPLHAVPPTRPSRRYIVKQLSRSERQSFLEFAPDYFRYGVLIVSG